MDDGYVDSFIVWKFLCIVMLTRLNRDLSQVIIFSVCDDLVLFVNFLNILFVEEIKMEEIFRISGGTLDLKYNNNNIPSVTMNWRQKYMIIIMMMMPCYGN